MCRRADRDHDLGRGALCRAAGLHSCSLRRERSDRRVWKQGHDLVPCCHHVGALRRHDGGRTVSWTLEHSLQGHEGKPAAFADPDMAFAQHHQAGRHGDFCVFDRNGCAGREPVAVFYANDPDGIVRKFPVLGDSALPESMKNRDGDQGLIKKVNLLQNLLTLFFVSGRKAARTRRAEESPTRTVPARRWQSQYVTR